MKSDVYFHCYGFKLNIQFKLYYSLCDYRVIIYEFNNCIYGQLEGWREIEISKKLQFKKNKYSEASIH